MANKALIESITYMPSGVLLDFAGTTAPTGWAMCDGAAISRTTYPELFAAIGTAYGVGDGSTTFNLPDFRGRFARYNDNMGTGAASRDTGRVHGTAQADELKSHNHGSPDGSQERVRNTSSSGFTKLAVGGSTGGGLESGAPMANTGGSETRPINLSCNKIIKL
jgi:microcystin-dependent protein